jgi:adenylate cyclase
MSEPLSRKWNPGVYLTLKTHVKDQIRVSLARSRLIPKGRTMPDLSSLTIGTAKQMNAAIMFFDLKDFTSVSSHISKEHTLILLNVITTTVMMIVRMWNGTVEKHTGDGVMAILGTETSDDTKIAKEAIESAMTIKYMMVNEIMPQLVSKGLPNLDFRIGIDMGQVLISRIGITGMNFLTAVSDVANRASKLEKLAKSNGIVIGNNLARTLHPHLCNFLVQGEDPSWNWHYKETSTPYNFYHFEYNWPAPKLWLDEWKSLVKTYGLLRRKYGH